ncbi:MAG TPA: sodium/solute symporter [Cytophagales bacterium]|nr:sodium/solute symporter [Cytophagales bacterium]
MPTFFSTDLLILVLFVVGIGYFSLRTTRASLTVEEYFFADKTLTWPVIGITIIASNISTEHFVAQAGDGYKVGLAYASYEWTASLVMIFVALVVLPKFLRAGIRTLPEYLEYRYNHNTRLIMAIVVVLIYIWVLLPSVIYLAAVTLNGIFKINIYMFILFIGIVSGVFSVFGGLNSVVKANIIFGILILLGGAIISLLGLIKVGGMSEFVKLNPHRLTSILPADDTRLPWTNVFLGGLWVLHYNYWCANQFIVQHSLASKTLSEGQKGLLFAATIKLFIPFLIIIPGIMGYNFFGTSLMDDTDKVFLNLINLLIPDGLKGIFLAILIGAAISTLHSQVHAATSIFSLDIFQRFINKEASDQKLVRTGRFFAIGLLAFACIRASFLTNSGGEDFYELIQRFWGYVAPALVILFSAGVLGRKSHALAANAILLLNPIIYHLCLLYLDESWSLLDKIGITWVVLMCIYIGLYFVFKLETPRAIPERNSEIKFERNLVVFIWSIFIFSAIAALYLVFI